jgi:hypothetical protein
MLSFAGISINSYPDIISAKTQNLNSGFYQSTTSDIPGVYFQNLSLHQIPPASFSLLVRFLDIPHIIPQLPFV